MSIVFWLTWRWRLGGCGGGGGRPAGRLGVAGPVSGPGGAAVYTPWIGRTVSVTLPVVYKSHGYNLCCFEAAVHSSCA